MDIPQEMMHYKYVYSPPPKPTFDTRLCTVFWCMDLIKKQRNKH